MDITLEEKYDLIKRNLLNEKSKNPIEIIKKLMHQDFINMHGPEHHFLDGASFLTAYNNVTKTINLEEALDKLMKRTHFMPGAMCGYWGICGSVASIGASLSIIHETGPLSNDDFYKDNMEYTSSVIKEMSTIGGPRCCKRNAFISLLIAAKFVNEKYGVQMDILDNKCEFSSWNKQCIKERCPFYNNK